MSGGSNTGGTDGGKRFDVAKRRERAASMKLQGFTWQAIADQMEYDSAASACADVRRGREQINLKFAQHVEDLREQENERYDALSVAWWPKALRGDWDAADRLLKLLERRAKLNGLDAPKEFSLALQRRNEMESTLVMEAVLAAFDAAGLPPDVRMAALEAATERLAQVDESSVIMGEIVGGDA